MDKSVLIKELRNMKLIAHRLGYQMTKYPENSLEVLETIFENQEMLDACSGFEFDICFTKDHVPVVIHDKYIDDISDSYGLIKEYNLKDLKKLKFQFRRSLKKNASAIYKIVTLEELLSFFDKNILKLEDKIIKIETKDYIFAAKSNFNTKNLKLLADLLNKFPKLSSNLVHLSFWPLNLSILKKIQKKSNYELTKNDLLCDYNLLVYLSRFMPYLDNISLRIKTKFLLTQDDSCSKRVNKKIKADIFWIKFANALNEKNIKYAIKKYGTVGLYTLNGSNEIEEICKKISSKFFIENSKNIIITTNNPLHIKKIK